MSEHAINLNRRRLLQAGAAGLLLTVSRVGMAAAASEIIAVRTWPSDTYTRVTLEASNSLKFKYFTIKDPERLVVDVEGVQLNAMLRALNGQVVDDPFIRAARAGQFTPTTVRIVLDLKNEVSPQVFTLPPVAEYRHRLVIDLYPTHSDDPLLALLNEFNKGDLDKDDKSAQSQPEKNQKKAERDNKGDKPDSTEPEKTAKADKNDKPRRESKRDQDDDDKPSKNNSRGTRPFTVMIDPGHGGEDPGAIGPSGTREKDVVLAISRLLKKRIDAMPGMRAYLTRDADIFIPLGVRVAKARQVRADLFISVHADAFIQSSARGSSVFTLSEKGATSTAAKWLAQTQNDADLVGGVKINTKDKYLAHTLLDLTQTATINDSVRLANSVLKQLGGINRLHKNQVEQAGFAVLKAPDIPSILVETAFISNPDEEAKLVNRAHQERIADAMLQGIKSYTNRGPIVARS
ncbi:N-acetylmuramoyl-L-alanine amidase [Aquaspirillum serpens]|uniref:N-acetylmuramoyl-L-alanine amidase n=1 Tax=Aquaspirillum serpens TaxID=190 RepID=UPI0003B4B060|nr:N-acetylmuramoyl-L-alanine amidase [Aquaspirillum serpens]